MDVNLRDGDGASPLHFASSRGHVETVRWLLKKGASITLDKYGKSPINDAADNDHMEVRGVDTHKHLSKEAHTHTHTYKLGMLCRLEISLHICK